MSYLSASLYHACAYVANKAKVCVRPACNKSSMEHIPCARPRSCMHAARELLMFSIRYEYVSVLPVYLHSQGIHDHLNFAGREGNSWLRCML